ncbi:MAG: hypothetical protein GEU90_19800 [Gemmatimonas sp.]|nr:hypothetical protein [Gemmatimonas sp.]
MATADSTPPVDLQDTGDPGAGASGDPLQRMPVEDTIMIEGTPQVMRIQPVIAPEGFPLDFRTAAPMDMRTGFNQSGGGESVRFEAEFGGVYSPQAFLGFTVLPAGTDEEEAGRIVQEMAAASDGTPVSPPRDAWAVEEFRFGGERAGFVALGWREDRWYYFTAQYPPEFGDGMGPRVGMILEQWRWGDGGEPLLD